MPVLILRPSSRTSPPAGPSRAGPLSLLAPPPTDKAGPTGRKEGIRRWRASLKSPACASRPANDREKERAQPALSSSPSRPRRSPRKGRPRNPCSRPRCRLRAPAAVSARPLTAGGRCPLLLEGKPARWSKGRRVASRVGSAGSDAVNSNLAPPRNFLTHCWRIRYQDVRWTSADLRPQLAGALSNAAKAWKKKSPAFFLPSLGEPRMRLVKQRSLRACDPA